MKTIVRELLDQRKIEFLIVDAELRIDKISQGAARLAEHPDKVRSGDDVRSAFPELDQIEREMHAVLRGNQTGIKLGRIPRKIAEGSPIYIDIDITPHQPEGLVVVLQEVTDRVKIEETLDRESTESKLLLSALSSSKAYLNKIIDSLADALFVTSPGGVIEIVNTSAVNLFGYHRGELIGHPISMIVKDSRFIPHSHEPHRLSDIEFLKNVELSCTTKTGKDIPVAFSCSAIEGTKDYVEGLVYLGRDMREGKKAQAEIYKLRSENLYLQEELHSTHNFEDMIGNSPPMMEVFNQIEKVAHTDSTVLLTGETGTGKELIAHAIHERSDRHTKVMVKVNCAALPAGLVESELFGHEKGAFTGAISRKVGRFELANGGTILLDELGELPLDTQAKLLRVLQEQEFETVGGTKTIKVNVRVIAATNKNLQEAVKLGAFRRDLFYRLNIFPIHVPPLRERTGDIPLLISYFVQKFSSRMGKRIDSVSQSTIDAFLKYPWPGNVRELASILERGVILCEGGMLKDINPGFSHISNISQPTQTGSLEDVQRDHIVSVIRECDGVIEGTNGAAARLGIPPSTLRSRMKKLEIKRRGRTYE